MQKGQMLDNGVIDVVQGETTLPLVNEINKGTKEAFRIVRDKGDTLILKGTKTGREIKTTVLEILKCMGEGSIKLNKTKERGEQK